MATEVDWNSVGTQTKGSGNGVGKIRRFKFEDGSSFKLRPIGTVVEFAKLYVEDTNRYVTVNIHHAAEASDILSKHAGKEIKYKHCYAVNAIDRADSQVRVLEGGKKMFDQIFHHCKRNNDKPGSATAWDFEISSVGNKLSRNYFVVPLAQTPMSPEQVAKLKNSGDMYKLRDDDKPGGTPSIYPCTPLNELVERAFSKKDEPDTGTPSSGGTKVDNLGF